MRSRWLPVLCTVLLAVQIVLSSAGSHSQTSSSFAVGDVKLGGINSVAVGSYFVPVPLSDATLRDVVEFLVGPPASFTHTTLRRHADPRFLCHAAKNRANPSRPRPPGHAAGIDHGP
jgi:hypothetical protein